MTNPQLRIGILGKGFLAEARIRCYRRVHGVDVQIVAIAAGSLEGAQTFAQQHGIGRAMTVEQLCAENSIDVVDICVPNALHRPFCERAAAGNKHVICTKPLSAYTGQDLGADADEQAVIRQDRSHMLAVALRDADAMLTATRKANVQLCYAENWLYAPALQKARALAASSGGRLLEIRGQEAHSGSHSVFSKQWRATGGGALLRLGAHPIAAILQLKRDEAQRTNTRIRVVSVQAEVADLSQVRGVEDHNRKIQKAGNSVENWGCAILAFDDGSRAIAHGGDHLLGGMQSFVELFGSNFHLRCNLSPNDMVRAYASVDGTFSGQYLQEKLDTQAGWSTPMPDEDWTSGQQAMIQAFCEQLARGERVQSDGQLGRAVVEVIYSAYQSAATGSRVTLH